MINEEERKILIEVLEKIIKENSEMCKECIYAGDPWGAEDCHRKEKALKEILEKVKNKRD